LTVDVADLDSFETRLPTILKAEFAQQFREDIRKKTREAMRYKAEQGYVTGSKVFGYDNVRIAKGHVERRIKEAEAAVVRDIYDRFAAGEGARSIALALNRASIPAPRAQQGRPSGWSSSTVRAVLERPLYRGTVVYGRTAKAYGRELGKGKQREKGMIPLPEDRWLRLERPALRIVEADVAARVDARRLDRRTTRYLASVAKGGRVPERAHGKYLLSGGMLVCPQCGSHFEARIAPWKGQANVYICSTRRRKPGVCTNTLALPITETDDDVLGIVEGEVLGTRFIEELLALVDTSPDPTAQLEAERQRLAGEIDNLVKSVAKGMPAEAIAPVVKAYQAEVARLDVELRKPRPERPNVDALRAALEQRAAQWKAELRAEPKVARLLLRRLVGPLTLWEESERGLRWDAPVTASSLLDGLSKMERPQRDSNPCFGLERATSWASGRWGPE
jgi:site-specific DNA recombinase